MLPPNIAQLAARAKAADSLGMRYTDVTVTALEGAVTEATMLVDERDALAAKLEAATRAVGTAAGIARDVRENAEYEYRNGPCGDCSCCTTAQCAERRCPADSLGDSICPCTGE